MHCVHCGAEIPDFAKFCTVCGKPQTVSEQPLKEPVESEQPVSAEEGEQPVDEGYAAPENASEGYKAANAQLPPAYSNPNYSSQAKATYTTAPGSDTNVLAIAGFVCSLIFIPVGLGVLTAIAGLVLSILGLGSAKKLPGNKGHGLALAGTIISAIRIALILIGLVALVAFMVRGVGYGAKEIINNWQDYLPYSY